MSRLEYLRRQRQLTQRQLATCCGLHQPQLSAIERGVLRPSEEQLQRLAAVLGVTPPEALLKPVSVVWPELPEDLA